MATDTVQSESQGTDPRRSVTLDRFLGNDAVREFLQRAWDRRSLPHAILIDGPDGIGKTTLAFALMRLIAAGGGDPATDVHALKVERGVHPDMLELRAKHSAGSQITLRDLGEIESLLLTPPLEAERKVVLIEPADRMNQNLANAMLKLLEEPPPGLLFVLLAADPGLVLETIRSRCVRLPLQPVEDPALIEWLRARRRLGDDESRLIARLAEGRPGQALRLCEAKILASRGELLGALRRLAREGFASLFQVAEVFLGVPDALEATLLMAVTLLRDVLVVQTRGEGVLNVDLEEALRELAQAAPEAGLLEAADRFEAAAAESAYFYTPQAKAHFVEILLADVGRMLRG